MIIHLRKDNFLIFSTLTGGKKNWSCSISVLSKNQRRYSYAFIFFPQGKNKLNVTETKFETVICNFKTQQAGTTGVLFISTLFFWAIAFVLVRNPGYTDLFWVSQLIYPVLKNLEANISSSALDHCRGSKYDIPNKPLWDKGYFKLKAQESQQAQQEASLEPPWSLPFTDKVETSEKWGLPRVSSPAEVLQPPRSQKVSTEMDLNKQILPH